MNNESGALIIQTVTYTALTTQTFFYKNNLSEHKAQILALNIMV